MSGCAVRLRRETIARQGGRCFGCGLQTWMVGPFDIHRIDPDRKGGVYVRGNVIAVCAECHLRYEGLSRGEILSLDPFGSYLW